MKINEKNNLASEIVGGLWDKFSPIEARKEHHNFLLKVVQEYSTENNSSKLNIFETCLGSGIDAIQLAKKGFNIVGNEFDKNYLKLAKKNINQHNVIIPVETYDWFNLSSYKRLFNVVTCLGNSICYIFDNQKEILQNFHNLLTENGILLIDERNFQYMLDNRNSILKNKEKVISEHTGLNKNILYGGEKYFPYPINITDELVTMGIWRKGLNKPISSLYFYPFKRKELLNLLQLIFGNNITIYSDYKLGYKENAGFYQYICQRKVND